MRRILDFFHVDNTFDWARGRLLKWCFRGETFMAQQTDREVYVVCGMGRDVTGLVSLVTSIISDINGNILDLEEDVFHGLFSIFLTVDLCGASISGAQFVAKMQAVAHQSGLQIITEKQRFSPRPRPKRLMRLLLIGPDHPGIVSAAAFVLANNGVNVEGARMISRGDLFAMEMDLDRGSSPKRTSEIEESVAGEMKRLKIRCFFQTEDVYHKRPRLLVFLPGDNLLEESLSDELGRSCSGRPTSRAQGAALLKGMKIQTVRAIAEGARLASEGEDLLHALKLMGYVVVLFVPGFDLFLEGLRESAPIDHIRSDRLIVEKGRLTGGIERLLEPGAHTRALLAELARGEQVGGDEIITIGAGDDADVLLKDCGIRVTIQEKLLRDLIEKQVITTAQIPGIMAAYGLAGR